MTDTDRYERQYRRTMALGWEERDGQEHTFCGPGSLTKNTRTAVPYLESVARRFTFHTVVDAGAGDLNWIGDVNWPAGLDYRPYDLVKRHPDVIEADVCVDPLPICDAILCRHTMNHMDPARVRAALENFRACADYLIATHFDTGVTDLAAVPTSRHFVKYDLRAFGLGEPLESVDEGKDCGRLALWRLTP